MKQYKRTPIKITQQGKPIVSGDAAVVIQEAENIVALSISMESKRCFVDASYGSSEGDIGIIIDCDENSLFLSEEAEDTVTLVEFPEYRGWQYFASSSGRYDIQVCLVKEY